MPRRFGLRRFGLRRFGLRRFGPRTLRTRLALLSALAAFGCLTAAGGVVLLAATRLLGQQAEGQVRQGAALVVPVARLADARSLEGICTNLATPSSGPVGGLQLRGFGQDEIVVELIRPDGSTCHALGSTGVHAVAPTAWGWRRVLGTDLPQGRGDHGERLLVLDEPLASGWRLRIARNLGRDVQVVLKLRGVLSGIGLVGGLAALGAGWVVARGGLRPVEGLARAAEHIARTQDLSVRIEVPQRGGGDEVTRLARAFDRMTSALAASRERQAQLVADAGHELRTPLTSLRTNVELLLRAEHSGRPLAPAQREALLRDVAAQLAELTQLAGELTALAHDDPAPVLGPVRLDEVAAFAVRRVRARAGERVLDVAVQEWEVDDADAAALQRAVVNVLDNAVKFSPPTSTVRVRLAGGLLTVDDEGPGVPHAFREEAFARFRRGEWARGLPGSGLGLAIVAQTVTRHGGSVTLDDAPGGGTRVRLLLPGHPPRGTVAPDDDPHSGAAGNVQQT